MKETNFEISLKRLGLIEGGYSNDPRDPGGETYRGISRVHNPDWKGWTRIDQHIEFCEEAMLMPLFDSYMTKCLDMDIPLQQLIKDRYKEKYWDVFEGDQIKSSSVADRVFNITVHINPKFTIESLQKVVNALNKHRAIPDLIIDGLIGRKTLQLLNDLCYIHGLDTPNYNDGLAEHIVKGLASYQCVYYLENANKKPKKRIYTKGFINRAFSFEEWLRGY